MRQTSEAAGEFRGLSATGSWSATELLNRHFSIIAVVFILFAFLIALAALGAYTALDAKDRLVTAAATATLLSVCLQHWRASHLQQTAAARDLLLELYKRRELYDSFIELVYHYTDDYWKQVESQAPPSDGTWRPNRRSSWRPELPIEPPRTKLYHPRYFGWSEEELRLDELLEYFNVIGIQYQRGLIPMRDIAATVGYYLTYIQMRGVVRYYLKLIREQWLHKPALGQNAEPMPYRPLVLLLAEHRRYNLKYGQTEARWFDSRARRRRPVVISCVRDYWRKAVTRDLRGPFLA